jgi:hypothetical protein
MPIADGNVNNGGTASIPVRDQSVMMCAFENPVVVG